MAVKAEEGRYKGTVGKALMRETWGSPEKIQSGGSSRRA
jgi:hypothetical protein